MGRASDEPGDDARRAMIAVTSSLAEVRKPFAGRTRMSSRSASLFVMWWCGGPSPWSAPARRSRSISSSHSDTRPLKSSASR